MKDFLWRVREGEERRGEKGKERRGEKREKRGEKGKGKKGGKRGKRKRGIAEQWGPPKIGEENDKRAKQAQSFSRRANCQQRPSERSSVRRWCTICVFQGAARWRREMKSSIEWDWFQARSSPGWGDMSDFSLFGTFGRASFWEGCLRTLNFRGVGSPNLWKRFHFTWNGSRTSLEGLEGKVGEDDQHADGSECW